MLTRLFSVKKAELITFLQNNLQPTCTRPPRPTIPPPPPPTWEPIDNKPRLTPQASVRLRPDRPRQPQLQPPYLQNLRPYQLKPKRGKETFIELLMKQESTPTSNQKQIKRMKKKLGKLNRKIRHSNKKHNGLISKRNSIKKESKELKGQREPKPEPEESFEPIKLEQACNGAYRNYRISGRSRMDIVTFSDKIRQNLIDE